MKTDRPVSTSRVIARANPIMFFAMFLLLGIGLLIHVRTLDQHGWLNPDAFASLSSRKGWLYGFPFVGHLITLVFAFFTGRALVKVMLLSMSKFDDVIFDGEHLHHTSRPWIGRSARSEVFARVVPSGGKGPIFRSDNLEIVHVVRRGRTKERRTICLRPSFYSDRLDQIVANLEACGIDVRRPHQGAPPPVWDRYGN